MALDGRTELEFEIHSKIFASSKHDLAKKVVCLNIFSAKFPSSLIQNMKVWDFVDFSLKWERFENGKSKECDFGGFPASQGGQKSTAPPPFQNGVKPNRFYSLFLNY